MFEKCEFCEKRGFEIVNFVKNEIFKMWILWKNDVLKLWILWKMRISKCEFYEKIGISKCDFCENWDFQSVNFWINWGYLPQCTFFGHFYLLKDFLRARAFHFKPKSRALTSLALNSSGMLEMLENEPSEERSNFLTTKSWRFSREWLRKRWKGRELEALEAPFLLAFKFQQDWLRPFN